MRTLSPEEETVRAIQDLIEANRSVRKALRQNEVILKRALKKLGQGADVPMTLRAMPADVPRQSANDALEEYTAARHNLRLVLITECLERGVSIGEIGRQWGFSRQLAARYAKEARSRD
jgi:hypothetical protein